MARQRDPDADAVSGRLVLTAFVVVVALTGLGVAALGRHAGPWAVVGTRLRSLGAELWPVLAPWLQAFGL